MYRRGTAAPHVRKIKKFKTLFLIDGAAAPPSVCEGGVLIQSHRH